MPGRISMDIFLTNKSIQRISIQQTVQHIQYNTEICRSKYMVFKTALSDD
jgi:hypothetical protein